MHAEPVEHGPGDVVPRPGQHLTDGLLGRPVAGGVGRVGERPFEPVRLFADGLRGGVRQGDEEDFAVPQHQGVAAELAAVGEHHRAVVGAGQHRPQVRQAEEVGEAGAGADLGDQVFQRGREGVPQIGGAGREPAPVGVRGVGGLQRVEPLPQAGEAVGEVRVGTAQSSEPVAGGHGPAQQDAPALFQQQYRVLRTAGVDRAGGGFGGQAPDARQAAFLVAADQSARSGERQEVQGQFVARQGVVPAVVRSGGGAPLPGREDPFVGGQGPGPGGLPVGVLGGTEHSRVTVSVMQGAQRVAVRLQVGAVGRRSLGDGPYGAAQFADGLLQFAGFSGGVVVPGEAGGAEVGEDHRERRVSVGNLLGGCLQQSDGLVEVCHLRGGREPGPQRVGEVVHPVGARLTGRGRQCQRPTRDVDRLVGGRGVAGHAVPALQDHSQIGEPHGVAWWRVPCRVERLPGQSGSLAQGGHVVCLDGALPQGDGEVRQGPGVGVRAGALLGEGGAAGGDGLVQHRRVTGPLRQPVQGVPEAVQPPGALRGAGAEEPRGLAQQRRGLLEPCHFVGVLGGQAEGDSEAGEQLGAVRVTGRAFGQGRAVNAQHLHPVGVVGGVLVPLAVGLGEVVQEEGAGRPSPWDGRQCGAPQVEGLTQGADVPLVHIRVVAHRGQVAQVGGSVFRPVRQDAERVPLGLRRAQKVRQKVWGGGCGGVVGGRGSRGAGSLPRRAAVDGDPLPRPQRLCEGAERLRRGLGLLGEAGGPVERVHRPVQVVGPLVQREPLLVREAQEPYVLRADRLALRPFTAQLDQCVQVVRASPQLVANLEGGHEVRGGPGDVPPGVRRRRVEQLPVEGDRLVEGGLVARGEVVGQQPIGALFLVSSVRRSSATPVEHAHPRVTPPDRVLPAFRGRPSSR
ncbi:hypothetical protein ACFU2J_06115 [Streptomyces sp. NPDC057387]|uniref:hypothetical protein n=1 Tax=Streptomyces sp. NPDC057387 TaxID=3346115 RepID=UPI00363D902D